MFAQWRAVSAPMLWKTCRAPRHQNHARIIRERICCPEKDRLRVETRFQGINPTRTHKFGAYESKYQGATLQGPLPEVTLW